MRRLTILLAAAGALMLLSASSAYAEIYYSGNITVNVAGSGSGEVVNRPDDGFFHPSNPPIECSYNGTSTSGSCAGEVAAIGEPEEEEIEEGLLFYAASLEATVAPGSELAGWQITGEGGKGGNCPPKANPNRCTLVSVEEEDKEFEVLATFCVEGTATKTQIGEEGGFPIYEYGCGEPVGPPLTISFEEGEGTVVSNPAGLECSRKAPATCTSLLVEEGSVTLTASPAPGYLFKSWKGCDSGGVNGRQCTINLNGAKTVGVKFIPVKTLLVSKSIPSGIASTSPGGVNCGSGCLSSSAMYKEGEVTLKTKPAKHFHFVEFTGGVGPATVCNGVKTETCSIPTLNAFAEIKEVYAEDAKHTLTLKKTGGGQGFVKTKPTSINCGYTCTAAKGEFFFNESAEVTVALSKGTTSVTWVKGAGTCTGSATTCSVPMSVDQELVAKFE